MDWWTVKELSLIDKYSDLISKYPKERDSIVKQVENLHFQLKLLFTLDCLYAKENDFRVEYGHTSSPGIIFRNKYGVILRLFTDYYEDGGIPMTVAEMWLWVKRGILRTFTYIGPGGKIPNPKLPEPIDMAISVYTNISNSLFDEGILK